VHDIQYGVILSSCDASLSDHPLCTQSSKLCADIGRSQSNDERNHLTKYIMQLSPFYFFAWIVLPDAFTFVKTEVLCSVFVVVCLYVLVCVRSVAAYEADICVTNDSFININTFERVVNQICDDRHLIESLRNSRGNQDDPSYLSDVSDRMLGIVTSPDL